MAGFLNMKRNIERRGFPYKLSCFFLGLLFLFGSARPCFPAITSEAPVQVSGPVFGGGNDKKAGTKFVLKGYSFEGEYLVINYDIPYPGMTKVKMFDSGDEMLWRGQYVNAEDGPHKLILRAGHLTSGETYKFVFDYKSQLNSLEVFVP